MDRSLGAMMDGVFAADENNIDEILEGLRQKNIKQYKIKTISSGAMLEVLIYPIWDTKNKDRGKKLFQSREAQEKLNIIKAQEKCVRFSNANFITGRDIWITLTYDDENLPTTIEEADRNIKNYISRCKSYCQRNGLPELKYIYATQFGEGRKHHHVILSIADLNAAEQLWTTQSERAKKRKNPFYNMRLMGRTNTRRLQDDDNGLEGLARYISRESSKNKKKFCYSRNLKKPIEKEFLSLGGKRLSRTKIVTMARDVSEFENLLKKAFGENYQINLAQIKQNDYVGGYYLYSKLRYKGVGATPGDTRWGGGTNKKKKRTSYKARGE